MEITKISGGYLNQGIEYILKEPAEILGSEQAHVFTDKGIVLLDTSVSIDGIFFDTIESLLNYLYL